MVANSVNEKSAPLKDLAYSEIKQRIQNSEFAPGGFLSERKLAELLRMSKTPIKAALSRLEFEGFVRVSPQQGIVVRELSLKEVSDHFELRIVLENFVIGAIVGRLTKPQQNAIEKNLTAQRQASKSLNIHRLVELDASFHLLLCSAVGNDAIVECLTQHRARMHRVIFEVMSRVPERAVHAVREHAAIYKAICKGDSDKATKLLQGHFETGRHNLFSGK